MRINVKLKKSNQNSLSDALEKRKVAGTDETMADAFNRLLSMKNSDKDAERIKDVKEALEQGVIGREPLAQEKGKQLTKAEVLRLYRVLADKRKEGILREMVDNTPDNYILANNGDILRNLTEDINKADFVAVDCETHDNGVKEGALDPWNGQMAGFSVSANERHYYVPMTHTDGNNVSHHRAVGEVIDALERSKLIMHNAPFDCKWFSVQLGADLTKALYADTRIMAMSLDENRSHRLKDLLTDWMNEPSDNFDELFHGKQFNEVGTDVALVYAAGDTDKTLKLFRWMDDVMEKREDLRKIKKLLFDVEMPVARTFIYADLRGIKLDKERAKTLDEEYEREENELEDKIRQWAGDINLNSPAQIKALLFDTLGLEDYEGGSTGVKVLNKLRKEHEVVKLLLKYREVEKLRKAFTIPLPKNIKHDGKIHPWHNTWGAATGRFSCKNPKTLGLTSVTA